MGKYRLKNVWLFVHAILMVRIPGFGKTLLARALPEMPPLVLIPLVLIPTFEF